MRMYLTMGQMGFSDPDWFVHGSDGSSPFEHGPSGINRHGDCYDPMVRQPRIEGSLERGEGVTAIACLLAMRGRSRKKPAKPTIVCPGANGHGDIRRVAAALGAEVVNPGLPVLRRKRVA